MYGDMPNNWSNELSGLARRAYLQRLYPHALLLPERQLDMYAKEAPENAPRSSRGFAIPGPVARSTLLSVIGLHWKEKGTPEGIYALDTGCCWGRRSDLPALGR